MAAKQRKVKNHSFQVPAVDWNNRVGQRSVCANQFLANYVTWKEIVLT